MTCSAQKLLPHPPCTAVVESPTSTIFEARMGVTALAGAGADRGVGAVAQGRSAGDRRAGSI